MRILVDTHILLWALGDPAKLPRAARAAILAPENDVLYSAASIWEIAIKAQLRRSAFVADPLAVAAAADESGFTHLAVTARHAAWTARLPPLHRDPFDRLLVAQALAEPARLLTVDAALRPYSELVTVF